MGLFDDVSAAVSRGTESAGRAAEKIRLNNQVNDINKRRQQLAAQLGASLYEATKDDAALRKGREALYDDIAACDAERTECQARLDELEAMSQAASSFRCVVCGASMTGGDLFCSGCGALADQARPQDVGTGSASVDTFCMACGNPMDKNDRFCMSCGNKRP